MEWYHLYGIVVATASFILVIALNLSNRRRDRKEYAFHKSVIKNAIYDAEIVMRSVSCLSRDYDYADEKDVSERIAEYAGRHMAKIDKYMEEIRSHRMYLKSDDPMMKKINEVVDTLEWFVDFYSSDGRGPSMKQRVVWNEDRGKIGSGIDRLLKVAERM